MEVSFEAEYWEEGGQYVARANRLNVMTCGTTRYEAEQALLEAVELFLETAQQEGTLEDVMTESGYVVVEGKWVPFSKPERREMELRI